MALDISKLANLGKSLNSGNNIFMKPKEIGEETIVRILPPLPALNGLFALTVERWWLNKKPYICPSTFGGPAVFQEELDEAMSSDDPDVVAAAQDKRSIVKKTEYWIPLLHLELQGTGRNAEYIVKGDAPRILTVGPQLYGKMIKLATNRRYQNDSDDGITDRVEGYNIALSREGSGLNTDYDAVIAEQMEMPAKYYRNIPDVYAMAEKMVSSEKYLRAVIREYLYGEPIPARLQDQEDKRREENKNATAPGARRSAKDDDELIESAAPARRKRPAPADEEEEDTPTRKRRPAARGEDDDEVEALEKALSGKRKATREDEELEEDDAPVGHKPRRVPARKSAPAKQADEDDDSPEEEDTKPARKSANKKAAKSIEDDLLDDAELDLDLDLD